MRFLLDGGPRRAGSAIMLRHASSESPDSIVYRIFHGYAGFCLTRDLHLGTA